MTDWQRDLETCDAATPGPWTFENDGTVGGIIVRPPTGRPHRHDSPEDAAFIAAARTRWPIALAEIERLRGLIVEACKLASIDTGKSVDEHIALARIAKEGSVEP